jgi:hypothetical protein
LTAPQDTGGLRAGQVIQRKASVRTMTRISQSERPVAPAVLQRRASGRNGLSIMITRRQFSGSFITAGASSMLAACAPGASGPSYEDAAQEVWRHGQVDRGDGVALRRELVRYATLAPSSHNTQCWKFGIADQSITIAPDLSRRCPAVDPDDHHLFVSLGCAAENLVQAALAHGLRGTPGVDAGRGALRIALEPTAAATSALFQAIPTRQCTRAEYDGKPISNDELRLLESAAASGGVQIVWLTEKAAKEQVLEFVVQGNTVQMNDRAFVEELKAWIRFNGREAARQGDGLYSASSGNPTVPTWLGRMLFGLFFTPESENDKYARHVRSSAGIAIFVGPANDKAGWIEVGRAYERFALQAAALGIRNAHLNQPVEVASLRPQFADAFGLSGRRPDLVIRFGRGPALPPSLRRPVQAVLA